MFKSLPPSAVPADPAAQKPRLMPPSATPAAQSEGRRRQVPRLPRKVERRHREPGARAVDVAKCHACHANTGNQGRHQSQPSAVSATPATQSEGRCSQVPHLPRKVGRRHREPSLPPSGSVVCLCVCVSKLYVGKWCVVCVCVGKW